MKVIYDFGTNKGEDLPYYLMKADRVVAVEANPVLCRQITERFGAEIQSGHLVLENCVLTDGGDALEVDFYLHKEKDQLSQFPAPAPQLADQYEAVRLPARPVAGLIEEHGAPHYVKIDIEHYDTQILRALFNQGVFPPYLSAESHSVEVFALMVALGGYDAFKLVDGPSVCEVYADRSIPCETGENPRTYSFPYHASGPFGQDIDGPWMTADHFFRRLAFEDLGWKDVHATRVHVADPSAKPLLRDHVRGRLKKHVANRVNWYLPEGLRLAS